MTADESVTMGQDSTAITQSGSYNHEPWTSMSPYNQSPYDGGNMTEYPGFGTYVSHCMTSAMPPAQPSLQHQQQNQILPHSTAMGHHQLPMLNTTWPSQLTNPTTSGSFSAPALSASSKPRIPPAIDTPKLPSQAEKGRKTLTTEQKRAMCQYHEENPGTRQADIGLRFGVERSTVSKVLRHKEQYLRRDQEPDPAALKRGNKTKNPDFDRTLSNYVRRQQQRGFDIKDEEIMEQARLFAHASGNQDAILGNLTGSWLQKFKQKHGVGGSARLHRRASETNMSDSARQVDPHRGRNGTPSKEVSPISPTHPISPLSGSRSDEDSHREQNVELDFTYRPQNSQSATSLPSDIRDTANSSFSGGTLSPISSFNFSPDPSVSGFQPMSMRQELPADIANREKRHSMFPSNDPGIAHRQASSAEPLTPQLPPPSAGPSALESPANEGPTTSYALSSGLTSPLSRSGGSTGTPARAPLTPVEPSAASPTQEDARRAAKTLLSYLQNIGVAFQDSDYHAVVQLTKRLEIQQQNNRPPAGGLSRIPEGDTEMSTPPSQAMMQAR